MKIYILILLFLVSCGVKTPLTGQKKPEDNITVIERNLTLTPSSITDQNAAELFDLGNAPSNGASKIVLNITNTTTNILTIDTNSLALKFSAAGNRYTIGSPNTCTGTLAANTGFCRIQIVLNNNATTALEDYTQPVEFNFITGASPTKTIPTINCPTGFSVVASTCAPSNLQFGKIIFTGQKAADVAISTVPLMSTLRFSTLAETYIMNSGSMTKRFYMGNPLQTGNTIPVPTVIAPPNGIISKNTCTSLTGLPPLKACFFEVTYNYDVTKPSLSEQITFGTPAPLNGVSLDTTGSAITLAITNQPPVIPVQAASFAQVSKITDLSSSTQQSRLYVTNTGSGVSDLTKVSIPAPFIIAKTSCSTSQPVGSKCFVDIKVDTSKTSNMIGSAPSISYGSSSSLVTAGVTVPSGQIAVCKIGFSFVNNSCIASNITKSCSISNGTGIQSSSDGGLTYTSCGVVTCDQNYYTTDNISCVPVLCTIANANLLNAATVTGDIISGCTISSCNTGFTLLINSCVSSNVTKTCTVALGAGTGSQTSTDAGQTYGACTLTSCGTNYQVSADKLSCDPVACTVANANLLNAATVAGDLVTGCNIASCNTGFTLLNGSCQTSNVSKSCTVALGSGTGIQTSTDAGQTYGACKLTSCGSNYQVSSDKLSCEPVACTVANSNLLNAATVTGDLVAGCTISSCNPTFSLVAGVCTTSNKSQACPITNGIGIQYSLDGGVTYGSCQVVSCDVNYTSLNNKCEVSNVSQACSVALGTGVGTQMSTDAGQTYGACQLTSCGVNYQVSADKLSCQPVACTELNTGLTNGLTFIGDKVSGCSVSSCKSGYIVLNGACASALVTQSCSTSIGLGVGTQDSLDAGQTFGACTLTSCSDPLYALSSDKLSCQPISCSMINTNFLNSASVSGNLVDGCSISSCLPSYTLLPNNSCELSTQSKTCSTISGSGTQTTTDGGQTWGICQLTSCNNIAQKIFNNSCIDLSRSCLSQPTNSTAGSETVTNSIIGNIIQGSSLTYGSCSNFTCINGSQLTVNGLKCSIPPVLTNNQTGLISKGGQITLIGTCEGSLPITFTEVGNGSNASINCSNGTYSKPYSVSTGTDGIKNIILEEINSDGIKTTVNVSYTLDKTVPTISINTLSGIDTTNVSSYSISGSCSENGQNVNIGITDSNSTTILASALCQFSNWVVASDLSSLIDGTISITATINDLANNSSNTNVIVSKMATYTLGQYVKPITEFYPIPYNMKGYTSIPYAGLSDFNSLAVNGSNIYLATKAGLAISIDNGVTWLTKNTFNGIINNSVNGVAINGSNIYLATGGGLSISKNNGATWTNPGIVIDKGILVNGSNIYGASSAGFLKSTDNGVTWTTYTTTNGLTSNIINGVAVNGSNIYLATSSGLAMSTDNGVTWQKKQTGIASLTVNGVAVSGSNIYLATAGGISISSDNGVTWATKRTIANGLGDNNVNSITLNGSTIYAATSYGVSISTDGITFVNHLSGLVGAGCKQIVLNASSMYVATSSGLAISTNNGTSFVNTGVTNSGLQITVLGISINGANIYVAGTGGTAVSTDNGISWTILNATNALGIATNSSNIYVATNAGLLISTDSGATWSNKTMGNGLGSNSVFAVAVDGSKVYAATLNGLAISSNSGGSFTNITGLGSSTVYGVAVNGLKIYAATSGGLTISNDGGVTWSNKTTINGLGSNSVNKIAINGNNIYAGTGNLSISTDSGLTFSAKTVGSNNIQSILVNGNNIYVGTPGGLSISTDGGSSFITKTTADGLDNNIVKSIGTNGTNLYIGTTSGFSIK